MRPEDLRKRTKTFALEVIDFCDRLPAQPKFQEMGGQLRRAANAIASNYRAAGRARSHAEFTAKLGTVLEEADESQHWLEMLADMGSTDDRLSWLRRESDELVAIFTASVKTAMRRRRKRSFEAGPGPSTAS
jgi:four helix bundle protein